MNFDLTSALLDLVSTYASIMIMLGQVDDRRYDVHVCVYCIAGNIGGELYLADMPTA